MSTERLHLSSVVFFLILLFLGTTSLSGAQIVTTGNLRVEASDESGAKLAGVKVAVSSPALIGRPMERETSDLGQAYFPTLPAGVYAVRFEKDGFGTVVRDGINVDVAVTFMVRVTMTAGSSPEVTTISGDAPRLDETTAEVGTTMSSEHLENIPTARDVWAVMQQAPRMRMERFDVGGSTMGTQTGFKNFGYGDQNRPMLDGVNLTEGTSGSGFYFDYGTFEQVNISGMGNNAEMPTPGTGYTMVVKSGSNQFHGMFYTDYESPSFQSNNLTDEVRSHLRPIPGYTGEIQTDKLISFKTYNANVGGPILKDKLWFFAGAFYQSMDKTKLGYALRPGIDPTENTRAHGPFITGQLKGTAFTLLADPTLKVTVLPTRSDRIVLLMADNWKTFPERGGDALNPVESTYWQASNAYARKVGWMRAFGTRGMLDATVGLGGYHWPDWSNSLKPAYYDISTGQYSGSRWAGTYQNYDPVRWQFYPTMTLFLDNWLGGSHDLKFGFDLEKYSANRLYDGHPQDGNVRYQLQNGKPYRVDLMNTPTRYNYWTWTKSAFITDTFTRGKWALSLGLRFDSYRADLPEMTTDGNNWASVLPEMFGPKTFPAVKGVVDWKAFAPRLGVTYLLTPKTVIKANYGRYWFFPGLISADANKNSLGGALFRWNDVNGNMLLDYDLGELGPISGAPYGGSAATIDPNLKQPYGDEFFISVDRELPRQVSVRALWLYKGINQYWQTVNAAWPIGEEGYIPVQAQELNEQGIPTGNFIELWNLKPEYVGQSQDQVSSLGSYDHNQNFEIVVQKRMSGGWQLMSSLDLTWEKQPYQARRGTSGSSIGYGVPQTPNDKQFNLQKHLQGVAKLSATFRLPLDVSVSPVLRYQLGGQWGRRASYARYVGPDGTLVPFNQGTFYVWTEEQSRRKPNIMLLDFRAEKSFQLWRGMRAGFMFDYFNIFNSNRMVNTTDLTGANFDKWTEILTPRIFRLGARFTF